MNTFDEEYPIAYKAKFTKALFRSRKVYLMSSETYPLLPQLEKLVSEKNDCTNIYDKHTKKTYTIDESKRMIKINQL
jgi:hypothetical protein